MNAVSLSLFVPNGLWPLLWCNSLGPQLDCLDSVSASSPRRDRAQGIIQLSLRTPSVPHANLHHFACPHHRPTLRIVSADVAA
ncbi:hypothetical protein B0H14DRAFT_2784184 [Mycena olivaceomarginata]|nr:hypothetical protein B0H14DRAFT_2784184 [Mycena olivaceomarginata]